MVLIIKANPNHNIYNLKRTTAETLNDVCFIFSTSGAGGVLIKVGRGWKFR